MREEKDDDGDTNKQEEAQQLSTTVSFSLQQNTWNILREKKKGYVDLWLFNFKI